MWRQDLAILSPEGPCDNTCQLWLLLDTCKERTACRRIVTCVPSQTAEPLRQLQTNLLTTHEELSLAMKAWARRVGEGHVVGIHARTQPNGLGERLKSPGEGCNGEGERQGSREVS